MSKHKQFFLVVVLVVGVLTASIGTVSADQEFDCLWDSSSAAFMHCSLAWLAEQTRSDLEIAIAYMAWLQEQKQLQAQQQQQPFQSGRNSQTWTAQQPQSTQGGWGGQDSQPWTAQ